MSEVEALPEDPEAQVRADLSALGVDFEALPCDPALADTAEFCAAYGVSAADSANAIIVISKRPAGRACACLLLADSRLDVNRAVAGALGVKRASFASATEPVGAVRVRPRTLTSPDGSEKRYQ